MLIKENEISELDVVLLKDGREATILEVFHDAGKAPDYLVEIVGSKMELLEIPFSQVEKIVWKMAEA